MPTTPGETFGKLFELGRDEQVQRLLALDPTAREGLFEALPDASAPDDARRKMRSMLVMLETSDDFSDGDYERFKGLTVDNFKAEFNRRVEHSGDNSRSFMQAVQRYLGMLQKLAAELSADREARLLRVYQPLAYIDEQMKALGDLMRADDGARYDLIGSQLYALKLMALAE